MTPVFSHQLEVRFRDCDAMGHVNNAVYLTYLEEARFHHWRASGVAKRALNSAPASDAGVPDDVPGVILARVEIDYRRPAKYGDLLRIDIGVAAIGRTSFTYEYEIVDVPTGRLVVSAKTIQVWFDYDAARSVPISDELKQRLSAAVDAVRT